MFPDRIEPFSDRNLPLAADNSLPTLADMPLASESLSSLDHPQPLVRKLPKEWTPEFCFRRLNQLFGCVWLDSSQVTEGLGRYSYLAADPFTCVRIDKHSNAPLERLQSLSAKFFQPKLEGLPPLQGGWMGWFGYEFGNCFEQLPRAAYDDFHLPLATLGLYDVVLSWDHVLHEGWIISQGWPATEAKSRQQHAYFRMKQFLRLIEDPKQLERTGGLLSIERKQNQTYHLLPEQLAPQFATRWSPEWTSNFASRDFRAAIRKCVDYVYAGDVFQVNLAQRLLHKAVCSSEELYLQLRDQNPAPFAGYANFGRVQVISSSPERFVQLQNGSMEARPIKGTRPRFLDPTADAGMAELLISSPKDRAENTMIVDLLRNDLSRVASVDSVQVTELCGLEKYAYVWHLVSTIRGLLAPQKTAYDLLSATFPGGSITGAPKIRAQEIIAELEPTVRGPYCGSLGYISFAGDMDLNVLIRTITACNGWWQVPVGGGIVADSDPVQEEQETWHKAEGILRAIDTAVGKRKPS